MASENIFLTWGSLALGAYGACLSTLLAYLHWWRDHGRFSLSPEVLNIKLDNKALVWRLIEVVNSGRRPLYLDDFGFIQMDGTKVSMRSHDSEYPLKLEEGQKHRSYTIDANIHPSNIKKIWASDTTGKLYYSDDSPFGRDA